MSARFSGASGAFSALGVTSTSSDQGLRHSPLAERTFTWNTVPFLILPPLKEARVREVAVVRLTSVTAAPSLPGAVRESS